MAGLTKREQMLECMNKMEDGMIDLKTNPHMSTYRLAWWMCRAIYLLLERAVKDNG